MPKETYGIAPKTAIILAAGKSVRFNGVTKQLLSLGDELIVERIIRQCKQHKYYPVVLTYNDEIINVATMNECEFLYPHKADTVCDTIGSMYGLWSPRTAILLGDVIYSKDAMSRIMGSKADFMAFGNAWEIFALSFNGKMSMNVKRAVEIAIETPPHKVRTVFMEYSYLSSMMKQDKYTLSKIDTFDYIDDYTNDIDTLNDYKNFIIEVVDRNRLDDRRPA